MTFNFWLILNFTSLHSTYIRTSRLAPTEWCRRIINHCWIHKPCLAVMRSSLANRQSTFGRFPTAGLCRAPHPSGSYLSQSIMRLWSCGGLHREGPGLARHRTQFSFCVTKSHLFMTQASLLWELPPILGKHLSPNIIWIQYVDDLLCSVMAVDIQHLLQVLAHRGCNVSKCKMQFIALKCLGHGMSPKGKTLFLKRINTINIFPLPKTMQRVSTISWLLPDQN